MEERLIKDNVEKVVIDQSYKEKLLKNGWKECTIDNEQSDNKELNKLKLEQLKELATEKGIDFDAKIKKEDLINLLENAE